MKRVEEREGGRERGRERECACSRLSHLIKNTRASNQAALTALPEKPQTTRTLLIRYKHITGSAGEKRASRGRGGAVGRPDMS